MRWVTRNLALAKLITMVVGREVGMLIQPPDSESCTAVGNQSVYDSTAGMPRNSP